MSVSVRQIKVPSEPHATYFLKVDWLEDLGAGFTVALCDGESAWIGEVSEEDVAREIQELEMRRERYVEELQLALAGGGQQGGDYTFQLSPESACGGPRHLTYEKVQKDISFRLGSVELQPSPEPDQVIKELIRIGLDRGSELRARNQHLQEENQRLKREQDRITAELEGYVEAKEKLEQDLYTRFVLVLNEKKAKIRGLQEELRRLQEAKEERAQREATTAESSGPMEADYGASTDEEQTQSIHCSQVSTVPVTDEASSSMDLGLSDIPDVAPSRKRRWRHLHDPGSEKVPQELQQTARKDPAPSKAEANEKAAQGPPDVATPSPKPENLFDDF
ncbi:DNA repair protein XRCC4-like [Megalops cyprinoides]|uniref:DNA repair protein XRCC4-like n=1 Tax=Megalops cyprinoides TaxID=118141 RepID=UPI00186490B5|nr:DNA repair protein XRCC4-like [Megalops cyprinoides]